MSARPLTTLYEEVMQAQRTKKVIGPVVLEEHPDRMLVFRLALNMNQRMLANTLGCSQGTIWAIENGHKKHIDTIDAQKVLRLFKNAEIRLPDIDILTKRYSEIAKRGVFNGEYAKLMASKSALSGSGIKSAVLKKPTIQEAELMSELNRQKIAFQFHGVMNTSRKLVVDFVFPSERSPKVIIEMKDLQLNYRKRAQAIDLAYRAIKMRQTYPAVKLIAVIKGKLQNDAFGIVKEEYDKVMLNPSSRAVIETVRGLIDSGA